MRRDLIIVENFYEEPELIVQYAREQQYLFPYQSHLDRDDGTQSIHWRTSRYRPASDCPFKSSKAFIDKLEKITGETIDLNYWNMNFPTTERGYAMPKDKLPPESERGCLWNCCFHFKHAKKEHRAAEVHSHTSADIWNSVGENGWVGIIYFNKGADVRAGVQTWNSKDPSKKYAWMPNPENWILVDDLANVYNRLILHRGHLPHCGAAGWGKDIQDGRLFQTIFFKTKQIELSAISTQDLGFIAPL